MVKESKYLYSKVERILKSWNTNKIESINFYEKKLLEYKINKLLKCINKRKELKITQTQLAESIGATQVTLSRIETGSEIPSLDLLYKIEAYLDRMENEYL